MLPTGTVTFLFTDIEGSTKLAREQPEHWEVLRQRHHEILRSAMDTQHGYIFQVIGDAFCVAFSTAGEALQAAAHAQAELYQENLHDFPVKVRMGIHTGRAELQEGGEYTGYLTMSRVQRLMSAGHGGQTLLSQSAQELVREELPDQIVLYDLGEHRLKDLIRPEHIYQVNIANLPSEFPPIKTLDTYHHNLPVQMTSFIGREKELSEIKQALAGHHLVTLVGTGGAGKTRLSVQAAAELIDEFNDGVWFVDFAPISDASLVPQVIATVLNVREEGATALLELLIHYFQNRQLLLVLDNCEHLVDPIARVVDRILHTAPQIKIIATSREALGVAGEQSFTVPSLSIAPPHHPSISTLSQFEATRLFIERALLVQPHFSVTNENAPAVAQICFRLDGIPLAIELAAARVKAMTPDQISSRLDDTFRFLTGGLRTALPRQQTLKATMDWSWELLSEAERAVLRRLSVFAGGWTLEAAESICAGDSLDELEILDLLSQLVSKSLVVWSEQGEPRYQLLETIRQYAHARLAENAADEANVRQRHAQYYAHFAEVAQPKLYSNDYAMWIGRLDAELDNLRSMLEWAVNAKSVLALTSIKRLGDYFWFREAYSEGIQWCERALNATPDAPADLRAYASAWIGFCSDQIGHIEQAVQAVKTSLDLARQSADKSVLALALFARGGVGIEVGEAQLAKECFEEGLQVAREAQLPFSLPGLLCYTGMMYILESDFSKAEVYFHESIEIAKKFFSVYWQPMGYLFSGGLALLRQDVDKARSNLTQGLHLARENQSNLFHTHIEEMLGRVQIIDGDYTNARAGLSHSLGMLRDMNLSACLAHGLEAWARLAIANGELARAARILGGIEGHLKSLGMHMIPIEQAFYDQTVEVLKKQLDAVTYRQEWEAGEKLTVEQVIELALQ